MPTFAELSAKQTRLIRKAKAVTLLVAPADADPIEAVTTGASATLAALPTGYRDGGLTTDDGISYARAVESDDVTSHGRTEPSISDKTSDTLTASVTFQEANATTISLYTGASVAEITAATDATTGELWLPTPELPEDRYYRLLAIARDQDRGGAGDIYFGYFLPRVKVTDYAEQAWGKTGSVDWGVTLTAYFDDELGYSRVPFFGGPGWRATAALRGGAAAPAGG